MNRNEILDQAKQATTVERDAQYGSPENNFQTIATMWNAYLNAGSHRTNAEITPSDVAAMMALVKVARLGNGTQQEDSWIDLAGYAACGGEISSPSVLDDILANIDDAPRSVVIPAKKLSTVSQSFRSGANGN